MESPVTESSSPPRREADQVDDFTGANEEDGRTPPDPLTRLASDSYLKPSCSFEQIRTFLAVASREHVTHAARALGLSQPAVTQQVHQLERALGVLLLQRVGRNVQLTDGGLRVAGACLQVMRSLENLERVARSVRGLEAGSLTIGATRVTADYYLSGVLSTFAFMHPAIKFEIAIANTTEICAHVAQGDLECGLVDSPLPMSNLVDVPVANDEVVFVAHPKHPLAHGERLHRRELSGSRYLVWEPGSATESIAAELLGPGYEHLSRLELTSLEAVRQSVLSGLGFAAVPKISVVDDLRSRSLVRLPVPSRIRSICAVRRPGPGGTAIEAFWPTLSATPRPAVHGGDVAARNGTA
jgi:DNA-binding transcriptional LysR family regulator